MPSIYYRRKIMAPSNPRPLNDMSEPPKLTSEKVPMTHSQNNNVVLFRNARKDSDYHQGTLTQRKYEVHNREMSAYDDTKNQQKANLGYQAQLSMNVKRLHG